MFAAYVGSLSGIRAMYAVTALCALLLLVACIFLLRKKETWLIALFASVLVVNCGYLLLSCAKTLDAALWANRIAYLGSAFLPLFLLRTICTLCGYRITKKFNIVLLLLGVGVFFLAASPGILTVYYKSVALQKTEGISILVKEYGSLHIVYPIYLFGCFASMIGMIVTASVKKKLRSVGYAVILLVAVFVNLAVWFSEQFIQERFEVLSVSYLISELFLLAIYAMPQPDETQKAEQTELPQTTYSGEFLQQRAYLLAQLPRLTPTERVVYDLYLAKKTTKEIREELNITENTLKYHNKNIYSKLGVRSRKQMLELADSEE